MRLISGTDRGQMTLFAHRLDDLIAADNPVRLIDAFVDALDMENHGFKPPNTRRKNDSGAPEYPARLLLKILVYGYMNKLRSSYNMERACRINVEMMWLTGMLHPSHTTICTFRRKHPKALKNVFRTYNRFPDKALGAFGKKNRGYRRQ